ncbi:hypothetical protein AGMMS49928_29900 [Spirochaetia bacterium]|nr:hypothetical protein AGMMS49928_29900 [Spirochaetia bacterium]
MRIAPDNWEALLELGKTCVTLGDTAQGKQYLQTLVSKNPAVPGKAEAEKILTGL